MDSRRKRLKKLVTLQEKLKELHETRHAAHLAAAIAAETEAHELVERFNAPDSLSALFPDLYHQRITRAATRREASLADAAAEASHVAAATARTRMVERAYREVMARDERETSDRERLEIIGRPRPDKG